MKIHLPQAILRTLSAAAVFVSTPLAVTVATGSFFAGTASAAIEVKKEGGDFVLSKNADGTFEETSANKYEGAGYEFNSSTGLLTLKGDVLTALQTNKGFVVGLNVPAVSVADTPIVSFGDGYPYFSLEVEVEVAEKTGKTSVTRRLWANPATGDDYGDITFNSATTSLVVNWSDKLYGTVGNDQFSCSLPASPLDMSNITAVTLHSTYVSEFTVKIDQANSVSYGDNLSKNYGSGTVLENELGSAAAIVLNTAKVHEVKDSTTAGYVKDADVYIGGGAQLKITSTTGQIDLANSKTAIFIDSEGTGVSADLVLSSSTADARANVYLGNVALVGNTSKIELSGAGKVGKISLLGSIKEAVGNRTLIIASADNSGLTLSDNGSINVGTLELQGTTIYLDGDGKVQAGAVTVGKGVGTGELYNVTMSGSGQTAILSGYNNKKGTVKNANVTVEGTVSNLNIENSTITLNGAGSVLGGVAATSTASTLAEGEVPAPKPTTIDNSTINLAAGTSIGEGTTVKNNSTINLATDTSIAKGTVSNSTISLNDGATGVTVSGDLQNDIIKLKNACSLTVQDAVLGTGTRFEAVGAATVAEGTGSTNPTQVAVTNSTVVLGATDVTRTEVIDTPHRDFGLKVYTNKLANVTSVSGITLSFTRDLITLMENQLGGKSSVHYAEIYFEEMNLSGDLQEGWVTGLTGEIPAGVNFISSGDLVTGVVVKLGPSAASLPEPTSTTLSILALAALAARRRRRKC